MTHAVVQVAGVLLAEAVLRRVAQAMAAQADLPIDRVNETMLAVGTAVAAVKSGTVTSRLDLGPQGMEVRIGPMDEASKAEIESGDLPALGAVLRGLADRVWMEGHDLCIAFSAVSSRVSPAI